MKRSASLLTAATITLCCLPARAATGDVRLSLPPVIHAAPGVECNLYLDNVVLVLDADDYAFDVRCDKGVQMAERWTFTPKEEDAGAYPISVTVRDVTNNAVAQGVTTLVVAAPSQPRPVTLLILGDSFTQASIYPQHVLDLLDADPLIEPVLIGCRGADNKPADGPLRHEGYSGWTAQAFVTLTGPLSRSGEFKRPDTGSPFVYESAAGTPALDFTRYFQQFNHGAAPDFVTILLGTNDVFSDTDDTIESRIDGVLDYYDQLLAAIREAGPDTRIGVLLTTPPSNSQDGFRNYRGAGKQTRWQYRRNQHRLVERMIERYAGRESEHVYLVPANVHLDAAHGFPTWTSPRDARSDEKVTRVNNGSHPSAAGYRQIGDSIYAWIKVMLNQEIRP